MLDFYGDYVLFFHNYTYYFFIIIQNIFLTSTPFCNVRVSTTTFYASPEKGAILTS